MVCKPVSHYGDLWSDLSLCFKVPWPVSLLLTADVMEIFGRIHKFLLTIRKTQIDLESMWLRISRKMKEERESRADTDDSFLSQFER